MLTRSQLVFFQPDDLIVLYLGFFNQEYGNEKGIQILTKVHSSKKIREFIKKLRNEKLSPGDDGFIKIVNSIPYFFFSKGETLGYGALCAIHLWIEESINDNFKLNSDEIHEIVVETISIAEKIQVKSFGNSNFFPKYSKLLEDVLKKSFEKLSDQNEY